jgi:hypothetical protein
LPGPYMSGWESCDERNGDILRMRDVFRDDLK